MKKSLPFFLCVIVLFSACRKDKEEVISEIVPNDFLSGTKYDRLMIQVQSVSGYELSTQTTDNLVAFLEQRLHKPGGIKVVSNTIASPGKAILTLDELKAIEKANRTAYPSGNTLTAYFFIADGEYSENQGNSKVLGIAYSPTAMVLFQKSIQAFSGGLSEPSASTLETTVIEHEFCHILGLVNNGSTMQTEHQDEPNGRHCDNSNCLMFSNINSSDAVANIFGNGIPFLDNNCVNDLRANGGK